MDVSDRPTNRSITSSSVKTHPSLARTWTSTRTARRSLSTSTPSQSKMTSSIILPSLPHHDRRARLNLGHSPGEASIVAVESPAMPLARVNDVSLYYEVTGRGLPLVLVHG